MIFANQVRINAGQHLHVLGRYTEGNLTIIQTAWCGQTLVTDGVILIEDDFSVTHVIPKVQPDRRKGVEPAGLRAVAC